MNRLVLLTLFGACFAAATIYPALAAPVRTHDELKAYEIVTLDGEPEAERFVIGTLEDFPEMYEFTTDRDFILSLELRSPVTDATSPDTMPTLTAIVVRTLEERGVEEITRLLPDESDWPSMEDSLSGLPYQAGPTYQETLPPGTYRIEVSNPENLGQYWLVIGTEDDSSFGEQIATVRALHRFYGHSAFGVLTSPILFYPLGILLILGLFGATWWYARRKK